MKVYILQYSPLKSHTVQPDILFFDVKYAKTRRKAFFQGQPASSVPNLFLFFAEVKRCCPTSRNRALPPTPDSDCVCTFAPSVMCLFCHAQPRYLQTIYSAPVFPVLFEKGEIPRRFRLDGLQNDVKTFQEVCAKYSTYCSLHTL